MSMSQRLVAYIGGSRGGVEICVKGLQKLKIDLLYDLTIPILDIYSKGSMSYSRDIYSSVLTAALFTMTPKWKDHEIYNENMMYLHKEMLFQLLKNVIMICRGK